MNTNKHASTLYLVMALVSGSAHAAIAIPDAHLRTYGFVPGSTGDIETIFYENIAIREDYSKSDNFGSIINYGYSVTLGDNPTVSAYALGTPSGTAQSFNTNFGYAELYWYFAVVDDLPSRAIQLEVNSASSLSISSTNASRFNSSNLNSVSAVSVGGSFVSIARTPTNISGSINTTITNSGPRTISILTNQLIEVRQGVSVGGGVWGPDFLSHSALNSFSFHLNESQGVTKDNVFISSGINKVGVVPEPGAYLVWAAGLIGIMLTGPGRQHLKLKGKEKEQENKEQ